VRIVAISTAAATVLISTGAAFALDSSMTMTSSMSPDALWKKVGDFCRIEALESVDNANHTYSHTILSGPLPVTNYHSTISVSPDPKGSSIKWVGKYDAKGASDTDAKKVIDDIYEGGEKALVGG
jgi:hypothetical protein